MENLRVQEFRKTNRNQAYLASILFDTLDPKNAFNDIEFPGDEADRNRRKKTKDKLQKKIDENELIESIRNPHEYKRRKKIIESNKESA